MPLRAARRGCPWSWYAWIVSSGIVLMVSGDQLLTYIVSG